MVFSRRLRFASVAASGALISSLSAKSADAYVIGGGKWGAPTLGTGASITWSLMEAGLETDAGPTVAPNSVLPSAYIDVVEGAFSAWAAVADLRFSRSTDPGVDWLHPAADAVELPPETSSLTRTKAGVTKSGVSVARPVSAFVA